MPRQARLDIPGLLHHVIARGVDGCRIFREDSDRNAFVARLSELLLETETDCFAWALLSNHFHLVLRPNREQLATVMRRLQTGHAVTFNRRHGRSGHLFQNRYKSIVCEAEEHLLELVRYVHLNPLRAGLVSDLDGLAHYAWSGHAVLLGRGELPGQAVDEVLARFGRTSREARKAYCEFVAVGVGQGHRDDLVGGGLRRSLKAIGSTRERIDYDARVLGRSEFVGRLREQESLRERLRPPVALEALPERVGRLYGLSEQEVCCKGRNPSVVRARALLCCVAVRELGYRTSDVATLLNMTPSGVSIAVRREQQGVDREQIRQILES